MNNSTYISPKIYTMLNIIDLNEKEEREIE
jgi:hypothetical protein